MSKYEVIHGAGCVPVKSWTRGVPFDGSARRQVANIAQLPFIHKWIAVMPDVHLGKGATPPPKKPLGSKVEISCNIIRGWVYMK